MNTSFAKFVLSFAALAFFATGSAYANGKTGGGTGSTGGTTDPVVIPGGTFDTAYVITESGSYVLGGNRSTSASVNVIEITAPDVTLDLNGFSLAQTGNGTGSGVYIPTVDNVEIRNGSIVTPGKFGIDAESGKGIRVSKVRVVAAGASGIDIFDDVAAAQISDCQATDCAIDGIYAGGGGSLITDCVVNGPGLSAAWGVGVRYGGRVVRTVVRNCKYGMVLGGATAVDCTVSACERGITMSDGASLRGVDVVLNTLYGVFTPSATSFIKDCHITGSATLVYGFYTDGGGNTIQ